MDPLLVLLLLGVICMAAMAQMMLLGGRRHWMGWYSDRASALHNPPETARQILDRRYGTGGIPKESYQAMIVDLETGAVAE